MFVVFLGLVGFRADMVDGCEGFGFVGLETLTCNLTLNPKS